MSIPKNKHSITVEEVMLKPNEVPVAHSDDYLKTVLEKMCDMQLGIACVVDDKFKLLGVITDGDIRRQLLIHQKPFSAFFIDDAIDHAFLNPTTIGVNEKLVDAVNLMKAKRIWDLPVTTGDGLLVGLLHLHPAVERLLSN